MFFYIPVQLITSLPPQKCPNPICEALIWKNLIKAVVYSFWGLATGCTSHNIAASTNVSFRCHSMKWSKTLNICLHLTVFQSLDAGSTSKVRYYKWWVQLATTLFLSTLVEYSLSQERPTVSIKGLSAELCMWSVLSAYWRGGTRWSGWWLVSEDNPVRVSFPSNLPRAS